MKRQEFVQDVYLVFQFIILPRIAAFKEIRSLVSLLRKLKFLLKVDRAN